MWGTFLSEPLLIVGMAGRYPAIYQIRRIAILYRISFKSKSCELNLASGINLTFARQFPSNGEARYALRTRAPVAGEESKLPSRCPSTCMG